MGAALLIEVLLVMWIASLTSFNPFIQYASMFVTIVITVVPVLTLLGYDELFK